MDLDFWQKNWNQLGIDDPLWAVLTDPAKKGGKWEPAEFFETGRKDIGDVMAELAALRLTPNRKGRALDFGCAVGRLSHALIEFFEEVHGVDISPSMIEHARRFGASQPRCHFHLNSSHHLDGFKDDSFDFVYSNIVLQHIEPKYEKGYIKEFLRVLKPNGVAVFQILSATLLRSFFPQFLVDRYRNLKHAGKPFIGMFGVPEEEVKQLVISQGGQVLKINRARLGWRWLSLTYFVIKTSRS